ncbi:negative elongation factor B [Strongylocentrotus purpuratus]|uniref:Negative elongation factor B n=1 Tax=Strongylocentrotus purpuratus TaxID=7668 RepID=A0A7M7RA91_STRPU|nr:negative elongation factor B [Strongylocentrotus purpuratus]|eukprot:XP_781074.3 PREDICTED: negative elongation factor B [Strongylocentrotus purpuratus]
MAGFEEVGIAGSVHLREALTNCTDPLQAIEDFQSENGILLPTLQPALPLLDLHMIQRFAFHHSIMEELREKLMSRAQELAKSDTKGRFKTIEDLLSKCFPLIRVKSIQPVVMSVMKCLPKIPEKYLTVLVEDRSLYDVASIEVKQQIWQRNPSLFGDEVSPLLTDYIKNKESVLFGSEAVNSQMFFLVSPKMRRQGHVVQKLTGMVGKSVKLFDMVLQFLRTLFLSTRNMHYCTLRAELLMSLHDLEIHEICTEDPCHKFTWTLDACVRDKQVDDKKAKELQGFLDGVRRGQEQVLGDLSMILCDPFAVHTLATSVIRHMTSLINQDKLPRDSPDLTSLLRMLSLGLGAWDMLDSQRFREPKLENDLILKFLPALLSLLVDDQMRIVNRRLNDTGDDSDLKTLPAFLLKYIRRNKIGATLILYYVLHVTSKRNKDALARALPNIVKMEGDLSFNDIFLHPFVAQLSVLIDDFSSDSFCEIIFDGFLLHGVSRENVARHSLRLMEFVFHKLPAAKLSKLQNALEPKPEHSQAVRDLYSSVMEKINSHTPSPIKVPEPIDSPLMSVPTPAPL